MDQSLRVHPADDAPDQGQDGVQDRHGRILDAAEHCFVRSGFHRTTMQDVAAEAGMSPGNLYRYFRSKEAIAAGLAERDRARVMADFGTLEDTDDFLASFSALARKHFEDEPRERAVLCLEIWAEATRNPAFASVTENFECDVIGRMRTLFAKAQQRGDIAPNVDVGALAVMLSALADGLFVRRAIAPSFDPAREVANVMAVVKAAFAGHIHFPSGPTKETTP
ncbi:MAG TPA: TetR/AcrR family transcriptional regulator [Microvirga sp.]|jgi:AcrR family transcriptional regulator